MAASSNSQSFSQAASRPPIAPTQCLVRAPALGSIAAQLGGSAQWLWEQADGSRSAAELVRDCPGSAAEAWRTLHLLRARGVLRARKRPALRVSGTYRTQAGHLQRELPEEYTHIQLSGTLRRRIDQAYAQLRTTTYYEFLGVAPDADREQIREAYFALAKIFHPDTQFRRELGDYKHKMEAVFGRLTRAYDVLSKRRLRAAYNEHLQALAAAGYSVYASLPTVR